MHYANCNTYNADFDGDEMNMHAPQDYLGRVEAMHILVGDRQYCVPTSGKPLRGIIQDHIGGAVLMTNRESMFQKDDMMQLVYTGLRNQMEGRKGQHFVRFPNLNAMMKDFKAELEGAESVLMERKVKHRTSFPKVGVPYRPLIIDEPAIRYKTTCPLTGKKMWKELWTGKQCFSILLKNLISINGGKQMMYHYSKSKTPGDMWNGLFDGNKEESTVRRI
jgi:DNA-directed RNA polymerase I subunit RPA1